MRRPSVTEQGRTRVPPLKRDHAGAVGLGGRFPAACGPCVQRGAHRLDHGQADGSERLNASMGTEWNSGFLKFQAKADP